MILVRIEGIQGDCEVDGYKSEGWFVAENISFSVGRSIEVAKKGGAQDLETGKGESQEISISKSVDRTTAYLMYKAIKDRTPNDQNNPVEVDIHFMENAYDPNANDTSDTASLKAYMKIKLGKALIKSWSIDGSGDERPGETISLWYNQVAIKYRSTTDGLTFQTHGPKGWDQAAKAEWKPPNWKWKDEA